MVVGRERARGATFAAVVAVLLERVFGADFAAPAQLRVQHADVDSRGAHSRAAAGVREQRPVYASPAHHWNPRPRPRIVDERAAVHSTR